MNGGGAAGLPEAWSQVRAPVIVPLLRLAVAVCLTMSVLLFLERMYMAVVISGVKILRRRPDRRYRCDPIPDDDPELGTSAFPVVLIQIPMFNEREVPSPSRRHCRHLPLLALLSLSLFFLSSFASRCGGVYLLTMRLYGIITHYYYYTFWFTYS